MIKCVRFSDIIRHNCRYRVKILNHKSVTVIFQFKKKNKEGGSTVLSG